MALTRREDAVTRRSAPATSGRAAGSGSASACGAPKSESAISRWSSSKTLTR